MGKLNFSSVKIRRSPGFRDGIKNEGLGNLSDGINIISGPNGAGKSTIARIIQQLVWTESSRGLSADAVYQLGDDTWSVVLDPDYRKVQKNGADAQPGGLPSSDSRGRYMLALHNLVQDKDKEMAKEVYREIIGGYNLEKAQADLGYSGKPKDARAEEYIEFIKALEGFNHAKNTQQALKEDEDTLDRLLEAKLRAEKSGLQKGFYEKVLAFLKSQDNYRQKNAILESYPETLKKATGEELQRIEALEQLIEAEQRKVLTAEKTILENTKEISGLPIPENGIERKTLEILKQRIEELEQTEKKVRENGPLLKNLEQESSKIMKGIDNCQDFESWGGIDLQDVDDIEHFYLSSLNVLFKKTSLEQDINRIGNETVYETEDRKKLEEGISALSKWLKEQKREKGISQLFAGILSITGILTIVATWIYGIYGLAGMPLLLLAWLIAFLQGRTKGGNENSGVRQDDYQKTGLRSPLRWDSGSVSLLLSELTAELTKSIENLVRSERLKNLKEQLDNLRQDINDIDLKRQLLLDKLKAVPALPDTVSDSNSALFVYISNVIKWQTVRSEFTGLQATQRELEEQKKNQLEQCNLIFSNLQAEKVFDFAEAKALVKQLEEFELLRKEAARVVTESRGIIDESKLQIVAFTGDSDSIYLKLGIVYGVKEEVRLLMGQYNDYQNASQASHTAKEQMAERESELKNHPNYPEFEKEIGGLTSDRVEQTIKELSIEANKLVGFVEEASRIETLINQKKEGAELENAIAFKESATEKLENLFENNLSSVTGDLLVSMLGTQNRAYNQPEVLKRANKLFNRVTRGRYELRVDEKAVEFQAFDTVLNQGLNLDEISTGTRVQLLIAIRIAFIETQEGEVKLPILADELLANSDDDRANAIIEALYEISREGRQIFYFTAQPDEVGKWMTFLNKKPDVNHKLILLDGNSTYENYVPDFNRLEFVHAIPEPGLMNITEYWKAAGIPTYNLLSHNSSQLSVAYLTEDINMAYKCLKSGFITWGQIESYYNLHGTVPDLNEATIQQMRFKAELLEYFQELYKQGRSRPVTMEVVLESGAISPSFEDRVREKLLEAKEDTNKFIDRINHLPNLQQNKKQKLHDHLVDQGYLDENTPVEQAEMGSKLLSKINSLGLEPQEAQDFINELSRP